MFENHARMGLSRVALPISGSRVLPSLMLIIPGSRNIPGTTRTQYSGFLQACAGVDYVLVEGNMLTELPCLMDLVDRVVFLTLNKVRL